MSLCILNSREREGIRAPAVTVEGHLADDLTALSIVGLPEPAVRESKDRGRGALLNSHFRFPTGRVTINLAPADLPKEGGRFDLPIAVGVLGASGQLKCDLLDRLEVHGELAFSGSLRPVTGILLAALAALAALWRRGMRGGPSSCPARTRTKRPSSRVSPSIPQITFFRSANTSRAPHCCPHSSTPSPVVPSAVIYPDLAEVRGQEQAKRTLEIAAAGAHSLLLLGPPGTGKSMLTNRLPGILPAMTEGEALKVPAVRSVSGREPFDPRTQHRCPFRSPYHTASSGVALVGGGSNPQPGEISLAHQGILFLDEFPEFDRRVLEALREPLESGHIHISRATRQAEFPARFQLVAAMNPCPCGYLGDAGARCGYTAEQVARYRARISGPLLDRIDLHVEVPRVNIDHLSVPMAAGVETSAQVRTRVEMARERQLDRAGKPNQLLTPSEIDRTCPLGEAARRLMSQALEQLGLSARAYHRVLKVAGSIADLASDHQIETVHLSEAIGYRKLDRAGSTR